MLFKKMNNPTVFEWRVKFQNHNKDKTFYLNILDYVGALTILMC